LGNGRYLTMRERGMVGFGLPRLIAQLNIEYEDGQHESIVSDDTWMATNDGPILTNNEFDGEEYDARKELGKWTIAGYNASLWKKADLMEEPGGELLAQTSENLNVMEEIKPVAIKLIADGKYILDMGQNMVGWLHINLKGKKDNPITMRFAELLKDNGEEIYLDNIRGALVTDIYTPAQDGLFAWEPLFVYHGFRYVEISGVD
jgi:alpha-L-rhamnosidase